ncbi:uncharacterized protein BDZ99DRAFT_467547 [Mytilinidion resinicola]|uniref:BTB domain-containing protein n=1 Tax=Mytilinidion resinicola TaxID=574789 RepID=A0A6A6Y7L5_9PEZI|nr:uncharacterized protein BDZ99DRAFT_467547 [Mytilinidion resinicola]KAF2804175.1 hypothetical protein BDZ99DRAFT_467547 [Mytilinidion resinicola]
MAPKGSSKRKRSVNDTTHSDQVTVTLIIGPDATPFDIHRELLCKRSEFFRGAFKGGFREAGERSMVLDDVSVFLMRQFMRWIYNGAFPFTATIEDGRNDDVHAILDPDELLDLYIFGDRYDLPTLRGDSLAMIQEAFHEEDDDSEEEFSDDGEEYSDVDEESADDEEESGSDEEESSDDEEESGDVEEENNDEEDDLSVPLEFVVRAYENLPHSSAMCKWLAWHMSKTWQPGDLHPDEFDTLSHLPHAFILAVAIYSRQRMERAIEDGVEVNDMALLLEEGDELTCQLHEHTLTGQCVDVADQSVLRKNFRKLDVLSG